MTRPAGTSTALTLPSILPVPGIRLFGLLAVLLPALLPTGVGAQDAPLSIPRLTGPVEIDGRVDEAAWMAIPPLPAVSSSPAYNVPPSERTEFRLAYDDQYLYLAGRMYDSDPSGIRATSLRRDDGAMSNDWLVVNLDTFMDRQTALVFGITPAGVRTDGIFANDADTGPNFGWSTFWDAQATTDAEGWSAEIRIPLSSLRFEVEEGRVVMGVTIWRNIARKAEIISWPGIEHRWGFFSIVKASQTHPVVLEGVERLNPVYVTPLCPVGTLPDESAGSRPYRLASPGRLGPGRGAGREAQPQQQPGHRPHGQHRLRPGGGR
jgi:hypothetical protein